jgi:hypothetical protein
MFQQRPKRQLQPHFAPPRQPLPGGRRTRKSHFATSTSRTSRTPTLYDTSTLTRLLLHAYSYTPTLTRLLLHAYTYTPECCLAMLHRQQTPAHATHSPRETRSRICTSLLLAYSYTPALTRLGACPLICTSYSDFREERALLRYEAYPALYA